MKDRHRRGSRGKLSAESGFVMDTVAEGTVDGLFFGSRSEETWISFFVFFHQNLNITQPESSSE